TEWRQAFQITASMIENEVETNRVIEWMKHYKPAIPSVFSVVPMVYVLISLVSLIGYGLGWIPGIALLFVFLGGLAITGIFLNRISRLYLDAGKMKETFAQYSKLIKAIEE